MKRLSFLSVLFLLPAIFLAGCEKDNYAAPGYQLEGRVVYNGQPLSLRSNGVQLELWQHGYDLFTKIPVFIAQDGSFSAELFDGDYKLVLLAGNGPWAVNTDSIDITAKTGSVEVEVDPYFIINNAAFQKSGDAVTATFSLEQINTSLGLEYARLYVGRTMFTDQNVFVDQVTKDASAIDITQSQSMTLTIPSSMAGQGFVYVRLGVKTLGVGELIYTLPQRIDL